MAEVKKKFSELDPGSVPFDGMETIAAVQGGITKRGTISGIHGAGWWDKLKAAFVDFVAPEALHANDADTIGGETSAELHNAGALIGTAPLSAIPAQLTGKNAATATSAAKLTNARTITLTGNATGSTSFDGSGNVSMSVTVGYATSAGSAGYATNAGSATNATNAGSATNATNAGYATNAGSATNATNAGYATNAGSATNATNAGYATNAGTSGSCSGNALTATNATYATRANNATYAQNAEYATNAGDAEYATNATNATHAAGAVYASQAPNEYGTTLPTASAANHGRFFYKPLQSQGDTEGLFYCTRTSSAAYSWRKISA